jgi:hypothetical protein
MTSVKDKDNSVRALPAVANVECITRTDLGRVVRSSSLPYSMFTPMRTGTVMLVLRANVTVA